MLLTPGGKFAIYAALIKLSIAVLPGGSFGAAGAGHLRLSLACKDDVLAEALRRVCRHYRVPYAE